MASYQPITVFAVACIPDLIFIIITLPPLLGGLGLGAAGPCLRCSAGLCRAAVHLNTTRVPNPHEGELCRSNSCNDIEFANPSCLASHSMPCSASRVK